MSVKDEIQHFRDIVYMSDTTADTFHEAGVKTVQNFIEIQRYLGTGVLQGGQADRTSCDGAGAAIWSRIHFEIPIKGLINGHRVYFDSTNRFKPTLDDTTAFVWLDEDDDLHETTWKPDSTNALILWSLWIRSGIIREFKDERAFIPDFLNKARDVQWRGFYDDWGQVPMSGNRNGDAIIMGSRLYIWNDNDAFDLDLERASWRDWSTNQAPIRAFKFIKVMPDGDLITADSTADTLTLVEGTNIRFRIENEDDATVEVKISEDLDMEADGGPWQIRRVKLVDATGFVHVKGSLTVWDKLRLDDMVFGAIKADTIRLIKGRDSTTSTSFYMADGTFTAGDIHIVKANLDATRRMMVDGGLDLTGNMTITGTLNGVVIENHDHRHEHPSVNPSLQGAGADVIDLSGISGFLRDKQNAIQLQGTGISTQAPIEGDVLKIVGGEWTPEPESTNFNFIDAMAVMNWGFGRPDNFDYLRRQCDEHLNFDSTDVWETLDLLRIFETGWTSESWYGGTFDGRHVYFSRWNADQFLKFSPDQAWSEDQERAGGDWNPSYWQYGTYQQYAGACFDGRYVYYAPATEDSPFLRFDTKFSTTRDGRAFRNEWFNISGDGGGVIDTTAWETVTQSQVGINAPCFGACFDGRWVYYGTTSDEFLRMDTRSQWGWDSTRAWEIADKNSAVYGALGMDTIFPFFDGRYVYYSPRTTESLIFRFDTEVAWRYGFSLNDSTCWSTVNIDILSDKSNNKITTNSCWGGTFDGNYVYFTPVSNSSDHILDNTTFARVDSLKDWSDTNNWEYMDMDHITGWDFGSGDKQHLFVGATFDGRYVYYAPRDSAQFARYNTTMNFTDPNAWKIIRKDRVLREPSANTFHGAIFDGEWVNFVPYEATKMCRCRAFPSGGMFSRWGQP